MTDPLLLRLDASQREAVMAASLPLAILAGAGSGKTRVLTHRIAWQSREEHIDPAHVLALTFTRKAAGELVTRLGRLGVRDRVTAGTFHAIALAQLRARQRDRDRPMPALLDRKVRLIAPMLREAGGPSGAEGSLAAMEVAAEIEWAKARLVGPDSYPVVVTAAGREPPRPLSEMTELYRSYEETKKRRRLVDFDDLIIWCGTTLTTDQEFRDAQRWRFRHLFVDEFQDVSPAQLQLVKAWLGDRSDLCVVGDPDQAIYGFAGAESGHLTGFSDLFPGATVVRLDANYRSTPQVLRAARAVLADGARQPLPFVRVPRDEGPLPTITTYDTDDEEARGVARAVRGAHDAGTPWKRLSVLYRTNAQSATFEAAFAAANVPCRVRGAGRFLERTEVKASLEALRASVKAAPGTAFKHQLADLAEDAAELSEERREHVEALARLGHEYVNAEGGTGSLDGFLAYLNTALRGEDGPETADSVELLTFHRAKGLEFDTVWVTGLEQGLVPISFADTPSQRSEERRLLYVACSRAERALHLSWAQERTFGMRVARRRPSPWVAVIHQAIADDPAAHRPPVDPRAELAKARSQLQSAGRADPAIVAVLAAWRSSVARAHDIDASVILTNATLDEVALARPTSRSALLAVPGVGPIAVDRYGDAILEVLRDDSAATR